MRLRPQIASFPLGRTGSVYGREVMAASRLVNKLSHGERPLHY
jgi:hypothetical protein